MHYKNDPTQEQQVWLIWEMKNDKPVLAVICTTDADLYRYVDSDLKFFSGTVKPVYCEKVMCDHCYGAHDLSIALAIGLRS